MLPNLVIPSPKVFVMLLLIGVFAADVGGLDGGVGAHGSHGDADVRPADEHRGVVDAVAHEGQLLSPAQSVLSSSSSSTFSTFPAGSNSAANLIDAQGLGHLVCHRLGVAGEHDGPMNTGGPQRLDSLPGVGLHHVGDDDMSGILPVRWPCG